MLSIGVAFALLATLPQEGRDGYRYRDYLVVILSEAKLQRSGRSPRGQAFNL